MKVKIVDPSKHPQWDVFVKKHPFGTVYHLSVWKEVIEKSFSHMKPLYIGLEDSNGHLHAILPCFLVDSPFTGKRLVSLPFTTYCDPLVETSKDIDRLLYFLLEQKEKLNASYIEIRIKDFPFVSNMNGFKSDTRFITQTLTLDGNLAQLRKAFHRSSVHQRINKAEKIGLIGRIGKTEKDLRLFYRLYLRTRQKCGLPAQPYRFFKHIFNDMIPKDLATFILILHDQSAISGKIALMYKHTLFSEYSGVDYRYLHCNPNQFLYWNSIEYAVHRGFQFFDFGRSDIHNENLVLFKKRWGTKSYSLNYLYYPSIYGISSMENDDLRYRLFSRIVRNIPLPWTEKVGRLVYKHMGG